jgi:hypothetical protein
MSETHEADAPHDYESPRGEMYPTEPCAVCGLSLSAGVHQPKGHSTTGRHRS